MTTTSTPRPEQPPDWGAANQRLMAAEVEHLRVRVAERVGAIAPTDPSVEETVEAVRAARAALGRPSALDQLVEALALTPFEREVLVLAAARELDGRVLAAAGTGGGDVTFNLAFSLGSDPHWDAVTPDRPLRAHRLVDLGAGPLLDAPLRVDERVLHHLLGSDSLDERLRPYVVEVAGPAIPLPPSLAVVASQLASWWRSDPPPGAVLLHGPSPEDHPLVATAATAILGSSVWSLRAGDLPPNPPERDAWLRLWHREAMLAGRVLLVRVDDASTTELVAAQAVAERPVGPVAVAAPERIALDGLAAAFAVPRPTRSEQLDLWCATLPEPSASIAATLADQLDLGFGELVAAARTCAPGPATAPAAAEAPRARIRTRLDGLAQRLDPRAGWDDLVLPPATLDLLRQLAAAVRGRSAVERAGFGRVTSRGLGVTTLFTGPSGTGKTLAAEVVAADLGLDLYRIDIAALVSKWIGETEKNLRRVFDAAEQGGTVLLFDEADALFGRRSEVRDSHDRYANLEVAYLLQRMEQYRGLAVLTTNLRANLDPAFLRRLRFVVAFPHPDVALRRRLWDAAFPDGLATDGLDTARLARLDLTGGNIRNIALQASLLAATNGGVVDRTHVRRAAAVEYAKLDRPLAELESWT